MKDFILSCCSTVDLNKDFLMQKNVSYLCFHYFLDGKEYVDDFGETIPYKQFYERMEKGEITKTSQINLNEFCEYFESIVSQGKDLIHVTLSSGLSGTYNSACLARDMTLEKYPDAKIHIVDSLGASSGYGLLVSLLADLKNQGASFEEVVEQAKYLVDHINYWFFSTDLKYYVRGGRVSKVAGFLGNLLHICPLLTVDKQGKLVVSEKVISKKKVILRIVSKMKELAKDGLDYNTKCYISHSACIDDANEVKRLIETSFVNLKDKIEIFDIGTTIGSHSGPGTVALFFVGEKPVR